MQVALSIGADVLCCLLRLLLEPVGGDLEVPMELLGMSLIVWSVRVFDKGIPEAHADFKRSVINQR